MMKKKLAIDLFGWLVVLLLAALLTGCGQKDTAPEVEAAVPVEVIIAEPDTLEDTAVVTGVLEAYRAVDVISEASGRIRVIRCDVGDRVEAGELLAGIEQQVARQGLAQAAAQLLAAESRYTMAFNDFRRDSTLFASNDISAVTHDNSRLNYQAALADLRNARAGQTLAQRQLNETDIRAPFGGLVAQRLCELGAYINPGQPLYRVVDIDSLRLHLGIAQRDVARLQPGAAVQITSDALVGRKFSGRIRSISPEADPQTRTFKVEVVLANPVGGPLRDGLVVRARLVLDRQHDVIAIPREAVLYRGGQAYLFVIEDGTAHSRPVTVGALIDGRYVIPDGLNEGDQVVVVGQRNLRSGRSVIIEGRAVPVPTSEEQGS